MKSISQRKTSYLSLIYGFLKKKKDTNELIYKTEIDSQTSCLPKGEEVGGVD